MGRVRMHTHAPTQKGAWTRDWYACDIGTHAHACTAASFRVRSLTGCILDLSIPSPPSPPRPPSPLSVSQLGREGSPELEDLRAFVMDRRC